MIGRILRYNWSDHLSIKLFANGQLGWFCYADLATLLRFWVWEKSPQCPQQLWNNEIMCSCCSKLLGKKNELQVLRVIFLFIPFFINFTTQLPFLFNFIQDNTYWAKIYNLSPWWIVRVLCSKNNNPLLELIHDQNYPFYNGEYKLF